MLVRSCSRNGIPCQGIADPHPRAIRPGLRSAHDDSQVVIHEEREGSRSTTTFVIGRSTPPWIATKAPGRPVFDGMTERTAEMFGWT